MLVCLIFVLNQIGTNDNSNKTTKDGKLPLRSQIFPIIGDAITVAIPPTIYINDFKFLSKPTLFSKYGTIKVITT